MVAAARSTPGAIVVGKTNLDQFATGLVGMRSPYGVPRNPFDARYIPGGSSSGSAVAVARGLVSFALGTDTAGSGRVPAAFNNIVGLKPTRGLLSTRGVVPACRSLDCVSVFALTVDDACAVAATLAAGFDASRIHARRDAARRLRRPRRGAARVPLRRCRATTSSIFSATPRRSASSRRPSSACARSAARAVAIDFAPFAEAAALLYDGPWVAERLVAGRASCCAKPTRCCR